MWQFRIRKYQFEVQVKHSVRMHPTKPGPNNLGFTIVYTVPLVPPTVLILRPPGLNDYKTGHQNVSCVHLKFTCLKTTYNLRLFSWSHWWYYTQEHLYGPIGGITHRNICMVPLVVLHPGTSVWSHWWYYTQEHLYCTIGGITHRNICIVTKLLTQQTENNDNMAIQQTGKTILL